MGVSECVATSSDGSFVAAPPLRARPRTFLMFRPFFVILREVCTAVVQCEVAHQTRVCGRWDRSDEAITAASERAA